MKAILSILVATLVAATSAQAVIVFNPADPLNVVDEGGFTGVGTSAGANYDQARLRFTFTSLNPSPLPSSFQITNISLEGPGITTSLSFPSVTITGNGAFLTSFVPLNTTLASVDFTLATVSFDLPAAAVNDGSSFAVAIRYADSLEDQVATTTSGPIYAAQAPAAVPEPGTWAAAALLAGGAAFARWRKRKTA
jgi:hypothetical protein